MHASFISEVEISPPIFPSPLSSLRDFIIDGLSVERNHILVRMSVIGGPSERRLPLRVLQKVSALLLTPLGLTSSRGSPDD